MSKEFQKYILIDFFDDPDFCGWVRGDRPDLEENYQQLLIKYPEQRDVFDKARRLLMLFSDEKFHTTHEVKAKNWSKIYNIYLQERNKTRKIRFFRYAAIFVLGLLISSVTVYFISTIPDNEFISVVNPPDYSETTLIGPGEKEIKILGNQSTIEFANDGSHVTINGKVLSQEGEGKEDYKLIVPYGKQSKIILSDETTVWLNASSCLVFPSIFGHSQRNVKIEGEAFFEVAKDKSKPFIVETNRSKIRVLGTSFNVRSSSNDDSIEETTLIEGSIALNLKNKIFGGNVLLKPEERISIESDNSFSMSRVDIRTLISWRDGVLIFKEEPLFIVLDKLSSFYGVKIKCADEVASTNKKISGKLDLKKGHEYALKSLGCILNGTYVKKGGVIILKLNSM